MASILTHRGYFELYWVIVVAFLGTLAADQGFFYLGRIKGSSLLRTRPKWQAGAVRARRLLDRFELPLIVGFRFMYGLRTITPLAIGISGYSPWRFLVFNSLGAAVWAVVIAYIGFAFGHILEGLIGHIEKYEGYVVSSVLMIAVGVWVAHKILRWLRGGSKTAVE